MWKYSYMLNNPLKPKGIRHFLHFSVLLNIAKHVSQSFVI